MASTYKDYIGSINKLDTEIMRISMLDIRDNVKKFQDCRNQIEKITSELLSTWAGKARNSYEIQYNLLTRKLKDIEDALYDFYDDMVESAELYIEADEEIAKNIR